MDEEKELAADLHDVELKLFLELPNLIVDNLPRQKLADIRNAISDLTESWKQANATPDAEGFICVPNGIDLFNWNNPQRVKFEDCPAWRIGITKGFTSPLSLLSDLYFEHGDQLTQRMNILLLHEYFAVAITEYGSVTPLNELARCHAWTANSLVNWLIHLRGDRGWVGVEPIGSFFLANHDAWQKQEYAKLKQIHEAQTRGFLNQKVTEKEIEWIKTEGQRMMNDNKSLKRWTVAGKLSQTLDGKILQKQVDNYLKDAGL